MSGWAQIDACLARRADLAAGLFGRLAAGTRDGAGITRASYGPGEDFAHRLLAAAAADLGFDVATDAACNTYMTFAGTDRTAPPVVVGSHLDSVAGGGNFDGAAGVVAGLTALAALRDAGFTPPCDVRVMGIRAEESAWFGVSYIGSRSALGQLPDGALDEATRVDTGRTLADHMAECGGDPEAVRAGPPALDPARVHAYLELHIEQGPVLDGEGLAVGIVTGIRGNRRFPSARVTGEYSHCGGVPRDYRRDAVVAASTFVAALDDLWAESEAAGRDMAVTVGKLFTDPAEHAMTKISGEVRFSLDFRSLDSAVLDQLEAAVRARAAAIAARRGVTFDLGRVTRAAVGPVDPAIRAALGAGATALAIPHRDIASGASHDAAAFAAAGVPTAMIFVRNANGSHNPHEAMAMDDFMAGTRLLVWWLASLRSP